MSALLSETPVRRYIVHTALAAFGINILFTVIFWQAFELTGNTMDIAWVGLAQFLPSVVLVLVSGWLADRFDRRRVTAVGLVGRVVCAFAAAAFTNTGSTEIWPLFVIAAALGAADAIFQPARRAITPLIVDSERLPQVVALWTMVFTASAIVGPVVGGVLIHFDPAWAYIVGGLFQLAAIVPVMTLKYVREPGRLTDRPTLRAALEGLTFIRSTPIVLSAISLDLLAVLFGGAIALIKPVSDALGVGDIGYGFLRAAPGVGAAGMALYLARRPLKRRIGPALLIAVGVFGFGTMVFGWTNSYYVAFAALVVSAAADMVSMVIRASMVPLATPDDQLGRVSAVEGVFIGASNELGAFESGFAARYLGTSASIVFGGAMTMVVAASFAILFPVVRRLDRFADISVSK